MTQTRPAPRHPDLRHLTHLSYYLIGGGQPVPRTRAIPMRPEGSAMEQASQIVMQALEQAKVRANTPRVETLSQ